MSDDSLVSGLLEAGDANDQLSEDLSLASYLVEEALRFDGTA
ncbi:MAG: hypothetical protein WCI50_07940 [Actinomycetes bacterium]